MSQLSRRESRTIHAPLVEEEDVWRASAAAAEAQHRRDEALRAEGRQEAWASVLLVLGAVVGITMGLRSPVAALLGLVLFVYGLLVTARITRAR